LGIPGLDGSFRLLKGLDWQFHDVTLSSRVKVALHGLAIHEHRAEFVPTLWEQSAAGKARQQILDQVWFTGVHSDVGGGYPQAGLSDVALEWMVQRAGKLAGLEFDPAALNLRPDAVAKGHDSFSTFYKILDWFRRKGGGSLRAYAQNPKMATCERIHESVFRRAEALPNEDWPDSFLAETKKHRGE